MPVLTLHLLQLCEPDTVESFLRQLADSKPTIDIIVASIPRYLVIRPVKNDVPNLVDTSYDLMLLLRAPNGSIPASLRSHIRKEYKVFAGIPSKLLSTYPQRNRMLLEQAPLARLTGSLDNPSVPESSQNLELSPGLLRFMKELEPRPVTMLNLLNFKEGGKPSYHRYGQEFIEVAGKRGGDAKIVGNVVKPTASVTDSPNTILGGDDKWQEIAIVHYASITHFCDMLAGEDYQAINEKFRLPALADTLLLCTTEIDLSTLGQKAKL